jgi:hypothetical protein
MTGQTGVLAMPGYRRVEILKRLFDKRERTDDPASCWLWVGSTNAPPKDYARLHAVGLKRTGAHRVAYELFVGPIPDGLDLDHLCRTPRCVNPFHLEAVTQRENIRRGTQGHDNRAKTHCPRGHAYDQANTYVNSRGQRMCRACGCERMRRARALRKERS